MSRNPAKLLPWLTAAILLFTHYGAQAADPVRGKTLYNSTPGGISCANSSCHGSSVSANRNKILLGANNPSLIQSAINGGTGGMDIYRGVLTSTDVADIAAYIGNPTATGSATASLSPGSLTFASTTVGATSATQTATLSNTGSASLSITALTAGGSNSSDFVRSGTCAAGGSVAAGSSCTLVYSFKPSASGTRTASLSVTSNASTVTLSLSGTGASAGSPGASVSPTALNFGTVAQGSLSSALSTTLSSTGTAALNITSISVTAGDFSITGGTCSAGASLAAGSSCTVQTKFQPTASGARSGTLSIGTGAGNQSVALSGTGGAASAPVAQLAPASLSFSTQQGQTSAAQTVTLSNTGTAALSISSVGFAGTAAGDYATAAGTTCSAGGSLAAGASCVVKITFTPQALGARSASLRIAHNDAAHSPSTVSLNGTGTSAASGQLSLDQVSLSFAAQVQNSSSAAKIVHVSNSGSAAVNFSSLAIAGTNAADFTLLAAGGACSASTVLAAGAICTLNVSFTPSVSSGTRTASVQIVSDASNNPVNVSLSGTAAAAAPIAAFDPSSLDFGSSGIGVPASAKTVALRNSGSAVLNINSLSVTPSDYTLSHNCPASLAAGASCSLQVGFTPSSSGSISGTLSLSSNAAGSPLTMALSGSGAAASGASLSWNPATGLDFASTAVGTQSAPMSVQLSNSGVTAAIIQQLGVAGAQASDFIIDGASSCASGNTLAAGASCDVVLVFAPSAAGTRSANLSVSTDGGAVTPLPLSGIGSAAGAATLTLSPEFMMLTGLANQALNPQALVLSNDGAGVLTITGYVVPSALSLESGGSSGGTCPNPPFQLQPGYSCSVMVTPKASGPIDGQIQVLSNSSSGPATAKVAGTPNTNVGGGGALLLGRYDTPAHAAASLGLLGLLLGLRLRQQRRRARLVTPS